jgi:hypothetical protein
MLEDDSEIRFRQDGQELPGRGEVPVGMNESSRGIWGGVSAFALLVSIGFSWSLLSVHPFAEIDGEVRERGGVLSVISQRPSFAFGFRNFFADIVWLEAVQVMGDLKIPPAEYDRLFELLNVEANFDPKFDIPYLLGGLVLGESPDHARKALKVFERGKGEYPADWRFPFYIGYTNYFSLGETETAGKAMAEAARLPGSPTYLPGLASRMLSEAKEPGAALAMVETIVRQENDPARRAVLERRIREVTVERDLQALERAVEWYREKMGVLPRELSDLVRAGVLSGIPPEPNGGRYLMEPGGMVRSDRVSQRLRVFQKK